MRRSRRSGSSCAASPGRSSRSSTRAGWPSDERASRSRWIPRSSLGRLPLPGEDAPRRVLEQRLPEPSADPEAVERLLLERLEREPPDAPVSRLDLELLDATPAAGHQLALFAPQANAAARLGWQLARLAVRYGEGRVGRVAIADPEARLAEMRWTWHPVAADGTRPGGMDRGS